MPAAGNYLGRLARTRPKKRTSPFQSVYSRSGDEPGIPCNSPPVVLNADEQFRMHIKMFQMSIRHAIPTVWRRDSLAIPTKYGMPNRICPESRLLVTQAMRSICAGLGRYSDA